MELSRARSSHATLDAFKSLIIVRVTVLLARYRVLKSRRDLCAVQPSRRIVRSQRIPLFTRRDFSAATEASSDTFDRLERLPRNSVDCGARRWPAIPAITGRQTFHEKVHLYTENDPI